MSTKESSPPGWPRSRPWPDEHWLTVDQARDKPGVKVTDSPHWAALWALALRGVLYVKSIPYLKVLHPPFSNEDPDAQSALYTWTAQTSVPTMVYGDGKRDVVRNDWLNQLMLAEQLSPAPSLVPNAVNERVTMFGFASEIMSPQGLMWQGRIAMAASLDTRHMSERQRDFFSPDKFLGGKYAHQGREAAPYDAMEAITTALDEQLARNQQTGSRYLVGDRLSAVDIYWAYASNMLSLLPHDQLPIMRVNRAMYAALNERLGDSLTARLRAHRDYIFETYLECPVVVD
ncbi:MAG: hypothetical protein AAF493_10600 [Pseudomonadota bacterium]